MCDECKTQGVDRREPKQLDRLRDQHEGKFAALEAAGTTGRVVMSQEQVLAEMFRYQPPTPITIPKYDAINRAAKNLAEVVLENCPVGSDRSAAIRLIREARMTANQAVALDGLSL